uniref:Uncharacterized protein n=1 Tax=uncultured bacterium contig00093 TaxID=1181564 RepID=A0A806KJP0_9BACT|nr:hypothetical protein [uncultured bacterium contig00093]
MPDNTQYRRLDDRRGADGLRADIARRQKYTRCNYRQSVYDWDSLSANPDGKTRAKTA